MDFAETEAGLASSAPASALLGQGSTGAMLSSSPRLQGFWRHTEVVTGRQTWCERERPPHQGTFAFIGDIHHPLHKPGQLLEADSLLCVLRGALVVPGLAGMRRDTHILPAGHSCWLLRGATGARAAASALVKRKAGHPSSIRGTKWICPFPMKVGLRFSFGFSSWQRFNEALSFSPFYCKLNIPKTVLKAGDS